MHGLLSLTLLHVKAVKSEPYNNIINLCHKIRVVVKTSRRKIKALTNLVNQNIDLLFSKSNKNKRNESLVSFACIPIITQFNYTKISHKRSTGLKSGDCKEHSI